MKFIKQEIDDFSSSNATQEYAVWDENATYNVEDDNNNLSNESVVKYGNYYYRTITDNNIGNNPLQTINQKWVKYAICNRNAMIDQSSLTTTEVVGDLIVEFDRNNIDTIGMGNVEASAIVVDYIEEDGTVLSDYQMYWGTPKDNNVFDLWQYMYGEYTEGIRANLWLRVLSMGAKIRVTFLAPEGGNTKVGFFIGGEAVDMGESLMGMRFGFDSNTTKQKDEFGSLNIIKRDVSDVVDFETIVNSGVVMDMKQKIKNIYNEVVLFALDPSESSKYENMLVLGVIQNASVVITNHTKSYISWSVVESI